MFGRRPERRTDGSSCTLADALVASVYRTDLPVVQAAEALPESDHTAAVRLGTGSVKLGQFRIYCHVRRHFTVTSNIFNRRRPDLSGSSFHDRFSHTPHTHPN